MLLPMLAAAATSLVGIVADPCPPPTPMSAETIAYYKALYATPPPSVAPQRLQPQMLAAARQAADEAARRADWADVCRYRADDLKLRAAPATEREIVFMGDSITEYWAFGDPAFYRRGWINRGISGQTTPQMLVRFPGDVLALHPRVVHIMAGTNDVAGNTGPQAIDTVEGNIAAMVALAKAAGIRVILAAVPPSSGFSWSPAPNVAVTIAALNARLKALALREKVTFVDYGEALATPEGALRPTLTFDGTHPDSAGYAVMAPLAKAAVAKALR